MVSIIKIKKATFYAYHGVMTEEQNVGGKFEVDVDLYVDFTEAALHDNLKDTVDYSRVYKFICKLALERKYNLIETLASKIADSILNEFTKVQKIAVRVRKHNVPVGGYVDYVEAEIIKENGK
jgi:dihydroneopterin aldolase